MRQFNVILFIASFTLFVPKKEELLHIKDVPENHSFQIGERFLCPEIRYSLTPYPMLGNEFEYDSIKKIADFIDRHPNYVFEIGAHTDSRGSDSANLVLSEKQAKAIYQNLVDSFAIDPTCIKNRGYGKQKPMVSDSLISKYRKIDPHKYEQLHQKNRRTEIQVLAIIE